MTAMGTIFDTWLLMTIGALFFWHGIAAIHANGIGVSSGVSLFGGSIVCAIVAILGRGDKALYKFATALRVTLVSCFVYFSWFQRQPWFYLDDSVTVRGTFETEFLLQRFEQIGIFVIIVGPLIALGKWHVRVLQKEAPPFRSKVSKSYLPTGLLLVSIAGMALAGRFSSLQSNSMYWIVGVILNGILFIELARGIHRSEFRASLVFAIFSVLTPALMLWP